MLSQPVTPAERFAAHAFASPRPEFWSAWERASSVESFPHSYSAAALEVAVPLLRAIAAGDVQQILLGDLAMERLVFAGRYFA